MNNRRIGLKYEKAIRDYINSNSGLTASKRKVIGWSGEEYEVDAVIYSSGEPVAYTEMKYHGAGKDKRSFENSIKRAIAQLCDLRYSKLPGALIVPRKKKTPQQSPDARLGAIGCLFVESGYIDKNNDPRHDIGDFLDSIQDFPTESQPNALEDYFDKITVRGIYDGLFFPGDSHQIDDQEVLSDSLKHLADKYFGDDR
jgi:hypothetical protein